MELGYWIAFWIFFGISVLCQFHPVFRISFLVLLVLMVTSNNQMSQYCWVTFWLSFGFAYKGLHDHIPAPAVGMGLVYGILAIARFFVTVDYEMPTPVFWVLVVLLALTYHGNTAGSFLHYVIVIFSIHSADDGIRIPGLQISYHIISALIITLFVVVNIMAHAQYTASILLWVIAVGVFRHEMWPNNREFGWKWIGAWYLLFQALNFAFAPYMPPPWYVMWAVIVVGLGFQFHPGQSLGGFALWAATILVLRFVLFFIYVFYFLNGARADLFPFNLFSSTWRKGRPRWFPLSAMKQDDHNIATLCEQCNNVIENSKLIIGSSYLARLVESHEFSTRVEFGSKFKKPDAEPGTSDIISDFPTSSCHLCCLMWYSMSPTRQDEIQDEIRRKTIQAGCDSHESTDDGRFGLSKPQDPEAELRIKVWEERPLSPYTYLQLHWGEIPIGSRLLVCRESQQTQDKPFATPSPAISSFKTNSTEHFEQAKKWLEMCRAGHKLCQGVGNAKLELPA